MEGLEMILSRRSIRHFQEQPLKEEEIHRILEAGMAGPSCVNARDWAFLVVTDRQRLIQMAEANGAPAEPLKRAALGILVCGDLKRAFSGAKEYWIIDASIAAQNMVLAAEALGIGSVWLGTWPQMERVEQQRKLFDLPDHIIPHSILAFGYSSKEAIGEKILYEEDRVHREKW